MKRVIQIQADSEDIEALISFTGQKAASKAFLIAADDMPFYKQKSERLEKENDELRLQLLKQNDLLKQIEAIYRQIQEITGQEDLL
ncbi:MAG: hypothetical protein K6L74_07480 [Neptuniibacter sp.]